MSSSTIFTGNSTYSQDFSQVIERTMAIAELPLVQLEQQRLRTADEAAAVEGLLGKFESLRLATAEISTQVSKTVFDASISQSDVATATVAEGASHGTYSLEVLDLGSYTSFLATTGVADPAVEGLGTETIKTLVVDGVETQFSLESNTLHALAEAINEAGAGVSASVINVSSTGTPSYKLVVRGEKLGSQAIALRDGDATGADLLEGTALQTGAALQYTLDGVSLSADSREVTIAPGLQLQINGTTGASGAATVTVGRTASRITDALQSFVAAYNQATAALGAHRGQGTGVLKGQSTVQTLSSLMRQITGYSGQDSEFATYTDLGLEFNEQGILALNTEKLNGLNDTSLDKLIGFLGGEGKGGFLGNALDGLAAATNADFGHLKSERDSLDKQADANQDRIDQMRERLNVMEKDLRERFAVVDSAIASLQQQALYINGMFEAMRVAQKSYSG